MMKKVSANGMTSIYHKRRELEDDIATGREYVSFEDPLSQSDVLSPNLPLNPKNQHIVLTEELKFMKSAYIIVNAARGEVMDEAALVEALEEGQNAGVGLPVFEEEPEIHPGLMKTRKKMLLRHMGTWKKQIQEQMESRVIRTIQSALKESKLLSIVLQQGGLQQISAWRFE